MSVYIFVSYVSRAAHQADVLILCFSFQVVRFCVCIEHGVEIDLYYLCVHFQCLISIIMQVVCYNTNVDLRVIIKVVHNKLTVC